MKKAELKEILVAEVADIFGMSVDEVSANMELNFISDLGATSLQFFPLLADLEEKLNVEVENHEFQNNAHTINEAVDFLAALVQLED